MNNRGQFSIIAALFVAIILVSSVMLTYSSIRYSPNQSDPQILSAIDETNLALKQVLGFTVGYYGSILQVTGNSTYAKTLATHYLDSGLESIADIRPEWGTSIRINNLSLNTNWFMNSSYSQGTLGVTYDLSGLGISGVAYSAFSRLDVNISPSPSETKVCLNVAKEDNQPVNDLSKGNFKFYLYRYGNLTWEMDTPDNEPVAFPNGTYLIDIPSGINPCSYVIQVADTRGLSVAASSFSQYTGILTFNTTVTPNGDYVDFSNPAVDGVQDSGTHTSFSAQQTGSDGLFDTLTEADTGNLNQNYNATNYVLDGATTLSSGSPGNLARDDGVYMTFGSYGSATSAQTLYAHKEITSISGTSYNSYLVTSADSSGSTLTASMANSRTILGKSVYSLQGISSIPASTWTLHYQAWKDASSTVAYDSASSTTSNSASFSWSQAVGTGNNRLLVVTVSTSRDGSGTAPVTVSSVTYNGVGMTQAATDVYTSNSNPQVRSYIFYLKNPASGTHTIQVTLSGNSYAVGGAASFSNVNQTTPVQSPNSSKGYSSSQSVTVSTLGGGQAVYSSLGSYLGSSYTVTDNSGQTRLWAQTSQRYEGIGVDELGVASGSASVGWTTSRTVGYVACAVAINPAASSAVGHIDANVLIRKSDNTIRQTIATNVASSGLLTAFASTLSGTYDWSAYTVVNQTDFLEIDYYVDASVTDATNAYLMIDTNGLPLASQTRVTNVLLPSQYTCQAELSAPSNLNDWNYLFWALNSSSTVGNVNTTFQLFNYKTGQYSTSGNGYLNAMVGTTVASYGQNITVNPADFRDNAGAWKIRFTVVNSSSTQFYINIDSAVLKTGIATYALSMEEQWTNLNYSTLTHAALCIDAGAMGADNLIVDVYEGTVWHPVTTTLITGWNNFSIASYIDAGSSNFTIRFRSNETGDLSQSNWQIDASLLRPESDQELFLSLNQPEATVAAELLQNGTIRWLGQNLQLTSQTIPIPPVPVKSIHVNETVEISENLFINQEVPFQVEDWASSYTVPLGLTNNATVFGNRQMVVFLVDTHVSEFTVWWDGTDDANQTSLAFHSSYFTGDNPDGHTLTNGKLTLSVTDVGKFTVTSTVGGSTSTTSFMRINNQLSTYGAGEAYVIHHGVIRDIIQQEAEWTNGVTNCPNIYANIVLTLPANATYFTYQSSLTFINSAQTRTISDLCPIKVTSSTAPTLVQTENGTALCDPLVVVANGTFVNYAFPSSPGTMHHWSQLTWNSGVQGTGIMFTDANAQKLYTFDPSATSATGALNVTSTLTTVEFSPVTKSLGQVNGFPTPNSLGVTWCGAVVTFDGSTPIYKGQSVAGLWVLAELPPTIAVKTDN